MAADQRGQGLWPGKVLHHTRGDEHDREKDRQRQEDAQAAAHQVDPEVTHPVGLVAGQGAHQGDAGRHADGGADERGHAQAGGHGEVAQSRFAGLVLPAGVGREAHCRVESQRGRHILVALGQRKI
jgi:hypothetical protein